MGSNTDRTYEFRGLQQQKTVVRLGDSSQRLVETLPQRVDRSNDRPLCRSEEQTLTGLPFDGSASAEVTAPRNRLVKVTAPKRAPVKRQISLRTPTEEQREQMMFEQAMERSMNELRLDKGYSNTAASLHHSYSNDSSVLYQAEISERAPMHRSSSSRYLPTRGPSPRINTFSRSQSSRFAPQRIPRQPIPSQPQVSDEVREQMMIEEALERSLTDLSSHHSFSNAEGHSCFNSSSSSRMNDSCSSFNEDASHRREYQRNRPPQRNYPSLSNSSSSRTNTKIRDSHTNEPFGSCGSFNEDVYRREVTLNAPVRGPGPSRFSHENYGRFNSEDAYRDDREAKPRPVRGPLEEEAYLRNRLKRIEDYMMKEAIKRSVRDVKQNEACARGA